MLELTEIDTSAAHLCEEPRIERWQVLEPVTARWAWLTVYTCCSQVVEEPGAASPEILPTVLGAVEPAEEVKKAA